jgi:hypothetical protein
MMNRTRTMTGIEKCIQVKKAKEMSEEMGESMMEAMMMVKTKKAMGYGKKK